MPKNSGFDYRLEFNKTVSDYQNGKIDKKTALRRCKQAKETAVEIYPFLEPDGSISEAYTAAKKIITG